MWLWSAASDDATDVFTHLRRRGRAARPLGEVAARGNQLQTVEFRFNFFDF